MDKSRVYKTVVALAKRDTPRTEYEMKIIVRRAAIALNSELPRDIVFDSADRIADTYVNDFGIFLKSMRLIPQDFDGDVIYQFYCSGGHNRCKCILRPMYWFWSISDRVDEYFISRLSSTKVA